MPVEEDVLGLDVSVHVVFVVEVPKSPKHLPRQQAARKEGTKQSTQDGEGGNRPLPLAWHKTGNNFLYRRREKKRQTPWKTREEHDII